MAIFRNVNMSFWTDTKVVDDYTPEDRYFMLYALTNPHTNIIGCYEISIKQMGNELGYNPDVVEKLLERFAEKHKIVEYNSETKELLVKNWHKYNWNASPKLDSPLLAAIEKIKSDKFYDYIATLYNERETVIEKIPYRYGIDTTITITNTIPITISNTITDSITKSNTIKDEDRFEELWSLYPRKQGKANAYKSYKKALKNGVSNNEIKQGIENYLQYIRVEKIKPEYIKMGSSWFNQECWKDEYKVRREITTKDLADAGAFDFSDFR